jgi:hypothetical protein
MVRLCCWNGRLCYKLHCDFIDGIGDVGVCEGHRNPHGRFMVRVSKPQLHGIFNKHLRS